LPLRRAVGDQGGEAQTLNNIAAIYFSNGELDKAVAIFEQVIKISRSVGAVSQEAAYLINVAMVYERMKRIDEALEAVEKGKLILLHYNLPHSAANQRIADYDAMIERLKGRRYGTSESSQEEQFAETMQMLRGIYDEDGAGAVREMLKQAGADDETIEAIIQMLSGDAP
jgi:tetratricopeptide (TPR) repeat protein